MFAHKAQYARWLKQQQRKQEIAKQKAIKAKEQLAARIVSRSKLSLAEVTTQSSAVYTKDQVKEGLDKGIFSLINKSEFDELNITPKIRTTKRKKSIIWNYVFNVVYTNSMTQVLSSKKIGKNIKRWVFCLKCKQLDELFGM